MSNLNKNRNLALSLFAVSLGMLMLSFASAPLYSLFCQVTGYGGTTQVAERAPQNALSQEMTVRFNADVEQGLPWTFAPDQRQVVVKIGEQKRISYHAKNNGAMPYTGTAIYNVTPHAAAEYFDKIQCFCFENHELVPGQKMELPVTFFIDPAIVNDPNVKDLKTVTLSYTFFKSKNAGARTKRP